MVDTYAVENADSAVANPDSFRDTEEPKSSSLVIEAIKHAEREFAGYRHLCERVDRIISAVGEIAAGRSEFYTDQEFDLFWASLEIMKPAVYAQPPDPVVSPRFQDRDRIKTKASEVLERCLTSIIARDDFDQVMIEARDDLIVAGRAIVRVAYEDSKDGGPGRSGGKRIVQYHVDRNDFLHEPARKWSETGWAAFAAYLTEREYKKRFPGKPLGEFNVRRDRQDDSQDVHGRDTAAKCKVWEVWHKADNRVYWVTDGVDVLLDESAPFLELDGFYPCPRPAFGTIRRRTMIPVPDYVRYESHLAQINELTRRIYGLLEWIKVRGLIPAGGDVGQAVETALRQTEDSDDVMLIPVPGAALMQGGQFVQFLPLEQFAATITGLLEARRELIGNLYELSGISDIMRGETEAAETLGAQRLKSQYGSIRIKEKVRELERLCRDVARISGEIIAEKFDQKTIEDMAQLELPARAEVTRQVKELEAAASREFADLEQQAAGAATAVGDGALTTQAQGEGVDPAAAEQQFAQAQQEIVARYEQAAKQMSELVTIEDVMELLRDQKARAFAIEIETDSTIMTDEIAEKQQRGEFLGAFAEATAALQPLLQVGEAGAKLAGAMLKFALAPFRAGRELDGMIDDFVDAAPAIMSAESDDPDDAMAEASQKLGEAELQKAQAQIMKVEADAAKAQQELQLRGQEAAAKAEADQHRLTLELEDTRGKLAETEARIQKIEADTQLAFARLGLERQKVGLEAKAETREDVKTAAEIEARQRGEQRADVEARDQAVNGPLVRDQAPNGPRFPRR